MNYLAHALLSGNNEHLLVGNFIADHLRGNKFDGLSAQIIEGIKLHRRIDEFTDQHPLFKKSKRYFYQNFEKHSGILVDIYFDHLLAKEFMSFSNTDLPSFSAKVYAVYENHRSVLPTGSNRFLNYVISNNIYQAYGETKGIETVLFHLSHRISHGVKLEDSLVDFLKHEDELRQDFSIFFSDAQEKFIK